MGASAGDVKGYFVRLDKTKYQNVTTWDENGFWICVDFHFSRTYFDLFAVITPSQRGSSTAQRYKLLLDRPKEKKSTMSYPYCSELCESLSVKSS